MSYRVLLSDEARVNLIAIRDWIADRSAEGAARWIEAFENAVAQLERDPLLSPKAPEDGRVAVQLRNIFFQTRHGRRYRAVFYIERDTVWITHVRGPRQQLIAPDEFEVS